MTRRSGWVILAVAGGIALASIAIPVFVIMPFRSQSEAGVAISYALRRWAPVVTMIALFVGGVLGAWLVQAAAGCRRAMPLLPLALLTASAWSARQNHFEWMFEGISQKLFGKMYRDDQGGKLLFVEGLSKEWWIRWSEVPAPR